MWDEWNQIQAAQERARLEAEERQRAHDERRRQREIEAAVAAERRARLEVWDGGAGTEPVERPIPVIECTDRCLAELWAACAPNRPPDHLIDLLIESHRAEEQDHA